MAKSKKKTSEDQWSLFATPAPSVPHCSPCASAPRCLQENEIDFETNDKAVLLEELFFAYAWCPLTNGIKNEAESYITDKQVLESAARLRAAGKITLKATNPFNIFKDAIRSLNRNSRYSARLHDLKITSRQVYGTGGSGMVLQFMPYKPWQINPFPNFFPHHEIGSVETLSSASMSAKQRHYTNGTGSSIAKVLEHLNVIGSHFTRFPPFDGCRVVSVDHVGNDLKGVPEIDALYDVVFEMPGGTFVTAYVTVEIKDRSEVVLEDQVRGQMVRVSHEVMQKKLRSLSPVEYVIGMAVAPREIAGDQNALCIWSLEPIRIARASDYVQAAAHEMPFTIRSEEAVRFLPRLSFD